VNAAQEQQSAKNALPATPRRIIMLQGSVLLATALVASFFGVSASSSVALGGLAALLPNALFAILFLSQKRERSGLKIVGYFYIGEVMKLLLTALLAVVFFKVFNLSLVSLLVGLGLVSISMLFAPLMSACCRTGGA